jgi:transposase
LDRLLDLNLTNPDNVRLAGYVGRHAEGMFTFLDDPCVEATNWPAEQGIRPAVVNRKMSGGNRTAKGARTQAVLMTVLRTCWQRDLDAIDLLRRLAHHVAPERFARYALGP